MAIRTLYSSVEYKPSVTNEEVLKPGKRGPVGVIEVQFLEMYTDDDGDEAGRMSNLLKVPVYENQHGWYYPYNRAIRPGQVPPRFVHAAINEGFAKAYQYRSDCWGLGQDHV